MSDDALDLNPWRDPDDLLTNLYRVSDEPDENLREPIARLLDHSDPDIREEAIRILSVQWKLQEYRDAVLNALRHDPQSAVRGQAAIGLSAVTTEVSRREDTEVLLDIVCDDSEELELRRAAYVGLLILYRKKRFPPANRPFEPDEHVDWIWIRKLRHKD